MRNDYMAVRDGRYVLRRSIKCKANNRVVHWACHSLYGQGWKLAAIGMMVGKHHTSVIHHLNGNCRCLSPRPLRRQNGVHP